MGEALFNEEFLKKLEYLYLVSRKLFAGRVRAERRTRKVGSGIEFADHREYAPGDDPKHLDWALYARLEKLFLRLFEEEEDLYVYVLVDVSGSMRNGSPSKLDYARRVAAALSYITLNSLDRVSVATFGPRLVGRLPPSRGKGNVFKVLTFLDRLETVPETDLTASIKEFVHKSSRRGVAIVLSDFFDRKGVEDALNLLRYNRFEIYALQVFDEREIDPGVKGDVELQDCETGATMRVTLSPRVIKHYRAAFEKFCKDLEDFCVAKEITLFRSAIQVPFEELVLDIFRNGGFLR